MFKSLSKVWLRTGGVLLLATIVYPVGVELRAGDNSEEVNIDLDILFDKHWDRRLYDATFASAIGWYYDSENQPATLSSTEFTGAVQNGFDTWGDINNGLSVDPSLTTPLIPVLAFAGNTSVIPDPSDGMKIGVVDGNSVISWETASPFFGAAGGVLAGTVSTALIENATTIPNPSGGSLLEVDTGVFIPLPGVPPGTLLKRGMIIEADIGFDSADDWRIKAPTTNPLSPGIDVQSVGTHEIGHTLGLSHTTVGIIISSSSPDQVASDDDATMVPTIDNTTNLRSLRFDDIASAIRTYTRNNGFAQNPAGLARITGRIVRDPGCSVAATGVSVRAIPISGGSSSSSSNSLSSSAALSGDLFLAMGAAGGPSAGACKPKGPTENRCSDALDNDCDGLIDGADPDCGGSGCTATESPELSCSDGLDNDCDGLTDGADADCGGGPPGGSCKPKGSIERKCSDSLDNDCDGFIDAADLDCGGSSCTPTENPETSCSDGLDNDCDGLADGADSDCSNGGVFPAAPDIVDSFSDSEFRSEVQPDGSFVLNVPAGSDYRIDVFTYNWFDPSSIFFAERYNYTVINSNTVNLGNFFCSPQALLFPAEATVTTLSAGQVADVGNVCVQSSLCTLGDPTP